MIRKFLVVVIALGIAGGIGFWLLSMPRTIAAGALPDHQADLENGAYLFRAGGCESCHAAPGAKGDDQLKLGGGLALKTPFGTFHAPNISPDRANGIGAWSTIDFVNAMKFGTAPDGTHLYPAFPYASYQRMTLEDLIDLKAYLDTLPPVSGAAAAHELPFPFNIRRGIGLWKLLYVDGTTLAPDPAKSAELNRGAYLVNGPGHCGECHSPRNAIGGIIADRAFSGGVAPEGDGHVPNITEDPDTGIGSWSEGDIVTFLETGFKPDFDAVGGSMTAVQANMATLTGEDRRAIAAYLKSLPAIKGEKPAKKSAAPAS